MPRFSDVVIAPGFSGTVSNGFGVPFYVSNTTNPGEFQGSAGPTAQGRSPRNPFATIQAAVDAAVAGRGDVIVIQRGTYTENVTVNKGGLTLLGAVPYGYPDHVIITGLTVFRGANISAYNVEFFSNSTAGASLKIGDGTAESVSAWCENCSFSSNGTIEPIVGVLIVGGNDHSFYKCHFVDNTNHMLVHTGLSSYPAGVNVVDCQFFEGTTVDIGTAAAVITDGDQYNGGAGGGITNFRCYNNNFGGGTAAPTDFINITGTSSGFMSGNRFATATNAAAVITIPGGILYGPNGTEAGWSTARPA